MKKYIFGRRFKFENYPQILRCHNEVYRLSDLSYEIEAEYEEGKCSREKWSQAIETVLNYKREVFAKVIYETFANKDLVLMDRRTKEKKNFDEIFSGNFKDFTNDTKNDLISIVDNIWGWKLPAEYYDKHDNIEKY